MDIAGPVADHTTYPAATPEDLDETIRLVEEAGGQILARQGDTRDLASRSSSSPTVSSVSVGSTT